MYITCPHCKERAHISLWKRIGGFLFKCPNCNTEINMEGKV